MDNIFAVRKISFITGSIRMTISKHQNFNSHKNINTANVKKKHQQLCYCSIKGVNIGGAQA